MLPPISPKSAIDRTQATEVVQRKDLKISFLPASATIEKGKQEVFAQDAVKRARLSEDQRISLHEVPTVPYELESLKNLLQKGDIFISYYPDNQSLVDLLIRTGQRLSACISGCPRTTEGSHNFVHAAMYVGNGHVSEAVGNGIVINELEGERFQLKPGMTQSFLIVRLKDAKLADEACLLADTLSARKEEQVPLSYSIMKAFDAGLANNQLSEKGISRYLQGAYFAKRGRMPTSGKGIRQFFCSYYVGWACQAAESDAVLKRVNEQLVKKKMAPIEIPDFSEYSDSERGRLVSDWAKEVAHKHLNLLKNEIKLDFDPKLMTPQHFYEFVLEHPELFEQVCRIVAPKVAA